MMQGICLQEIEWDMTIFGIQPYYFWVHVAILIGVLFCMFCIYFKYEDVNIFAACSMWGGLGIITGGSLFGAIVGCAKALASGQGLGPEALINGGFVSFGGIAGGMLFYMFGLKLSTRRCKKRSRELPDKRIHYDVLAMGVPLFHSIARLGCLHAGCCYGKETEAGFYVTYIQQNGDMVQRIPVQLIESICLFFIFICILIAWCKGKTNLFWIYISSYAVVRFCLEFIRGDNVRGVYGGISTGQIVCVGVLFIILLLQIRRKVT